MKFNCSTELPSAHIYFPLMSLEWLERQLMEVEALKAVYDLPPESRVIFSDAEATALRLGELSFTVLLPVSLNGPVHLHVTLPCGYPCADGKAARIRASASGASRDANTGLQRAVNEALAESQGGESVLAAAASAAAAAEELAVSLDAAGRDAGAGAGTTPPPAQQSALCRCLIWFHHIKSLQKRKDILAWATELRLGGFSKPGFPGVIIAEGAADDVDEYIGRLRALRWQAMSVREQELVQVAEGASVDAARAFPVDFRELPETGMSDLGAACRAAGLERLFLTALKI